MRSTERNKQNGAQRETNRRNIAALAEGMERQGRLMNDLHERVATLEAENATRTQDFHNLRNQLAQIMGKVGNIGPTG